MTNRKFTTNVFGEIFQEVLDLVYEQMHETGRYPEITNPYTREVKEFCGFEKDGLKVQEVGNENCDEVQFIPCTPSDPVSLHWIIAVLQLAA